MVAKFGNPKIFVIIPVYNTQDWLKECIDSVLCQSLQDFEVICIDDVSTDRSGKILRDYAEKDERFALIVNENKGVSASRNEGWDISCQRFQTFKDYGCWSG